MHLHNHSCYSFLDGLSTPEQIVKKAVELGHNAIALTDHGNMHGHIDFYKACKKQEIKPILGCEVYVTPDLRVKDKTALSELPYDRSHLVLLARNREGYTNLCRIVSLSSVKGFYFKPRVDDDLLKQYSHGIIASSACLGGEIPRLILRGELDQAIEKILFYESIFDKFYLEIQSNNIPEQQIVNEQLSAIGKALNIPVIVTCDSHYVDISDGNTHRNFVTLGKASSKDSDHKWEDIYADAWLKSDQDILSSGIPQSAIENTKEVAEACDVTIEMGHLYMPNFTVSAEYTLDTYLEKLCYDGLFYISMQQDIDLNTYTQRLQYELSVVKQKELSGYFLIVWDIIEEAKRRNIGLGPGRGSAAGSLISYCLGITKIDPIVHKLLFERFLNPERKSMPDIDIDIDSNRRGEMIEYLAQKYGQENVCQIASFGTLQSKAAIKDAARILGIEFEEINKITKLVPVEDGRVYTIQEAIDTVPEFAKAEEKYREVFDLARHLAGLPRHASMHAAGVIVAPSPITDFLPLMRGKNEEVVAQFEKDTVEELGLLKMDLLGLNTISILQTASDLIYQNHGIHINPDSINFEDKETLDLISRGKTIGVFQLESDGMQHIFKNINHVTFDSLIAGVALN